MENANSQIHDEGYEAPIRWAPDGSQMARPLEMLKIGPSDFGKTQQQHAETATQSRKMEALARKATIKAIVEKHNLFFVYIRHYNMEYYMEPKGGMVLAYKIPVKGGKVIEVATSICNDHDSFDRDYGRYLAVTNFEQGKKIQIKLDHGSHYSQQLREMFQFQE